MYHRAIVALIFSLAASTLMATSLVAVVALDQLEMKRDCEAELSRNAHCIAGYFPMEVVESYAGTDIEVPKEK